MGRIAETVLVLCAVLAAPAVADWVYDGTYVYISDPFSYESPDGTIWCGWEGSGDVDGSPGRLVAEGQTDGWAGISFTPDLGFARGAWAGSEIHGVSPYHWVPGGSQPLVLLLTMEIYDAQLDFWGLALDRTGTCDAESRASTNASGEGRLIFSGGPEYVGSGTCEGFASSQGGTYACTSPSNVDPYYEYCDYWQIFLEGGFDGSLYFTCGWGRGWYGTPRDETIYLESMVCGGTTAYGQFVIHDPNFYWGGADAEATYYIDACCQADLIGDIR